MNKRKLRASIRKYAFGLPKASQSPATKPVVTKSTLTPIDDQDLVQLDVVLGAVETSNQTEVIEFALGK